MIVQRRKVPMSRVQPVLAVVLLLANAVVAQAGLYYSGEQIADLPSQWRGYLLDQRTLRNIAIKPTEKRPAGPDRLRYEKALKELERIAKDRPFTADELADQGAILVRLGETAGAVEILRGAQRRYPNHFRIAANLGTAYQMQGEYESAISALEEAVRLAPGKYQKVEEAHLRLVRLRHKEPKGSQDLDDIFKIAFVGENGKYEPGKLAAGELKKLPSDAAAIVQQLALWLPADGRLLWQLAELAGAFGDVRTAASIMDGCVSEFGMRSAELRQHRQANRTLADELAKKQDEGAKAAHESHVGGLKARSSRPLANKLDTTGLPPISATGVNALPWSVLNDTTLGRKFNPTFPQYLRELDGKQVTLTGFMQPLGEDLELSSFLLIEYPVGCWYCEMPAATGIVYVELPPEKTIGYGRTAVKIEGKLTLNSNDPENFLYTISKAKVTKAE
jgi:tetratricopeptide (TPR) repeat protein